MRRPSLLSVLLVLLPLPTMLGCASSHRDITTWVADSGGVCEKGPPTDRVRALAARVTDGCADATIDVSVLHRDDLSAFSWPGGQVFVSRGIVEALDDELLMAAIAHELAHVLNHRDIRQVAGLRSLSATLAAELKADRVGMKLLTARGVRPDAMRRMLCRISEDPRLPIRIKNDLRCRIASLAADEGRSSRPN